MAYRSFEELDVWKRSCKLAVEIYLTLKACKEFSLRDQMNKAAVSISSNIAEGAERNSVKEFIRFLHIAKGSSAELRTQLYIAEKIGILTAKTTRPLITETKEISSMLQGLIKSKELKTKL
ncbi:MAG: four helix bundle protein [Bacteroidetes bacterium]|nr:four helix bundle protein [Bacteroidota bacterium]